MTFKSVFLSLALLALPGSVAAQGSAQALYFVFKLGTTLPLTVQDTPECAAEQTGWQDVTARPAGFPASAPASRSASVVPFLVTYSFVSPQGSAALRRDLEAFAQEHSFAASALAPGESAEGAEGADQPPGRQFTDAAVSGFSYAVRVFERPGTAVPRSVLCVTVFSPAEPTPAEPASEEF